MGLQSPSKKIAVLGVVALTIIALLLVQKFWNTNEESAVVTPGYTIDPESYSNQIAVLDSDNNGIADWKDMLLASTTPSTASSTAGSEPKTISESIARNALANVIYLTNNGEKELSDADKNILVDNFVASLQNSLVYKEYSATGLKASAVPDADSIRAYASAFARLQVGMILEMQKKIPQIEKDMAVLARIYAREASDLYALEVPSPIADIHLQAVNNFSKAAAAFEAIAAEKEDPLKLPFAVQLYQQASDDQDTRLYEIARFIKDNGIIFDKNEVGGYWNAFLAQ